MSEQLKCEEKTRRFRHSACTYDAKYYVKIGALRKTAYCGVHSRKFNWARQELTDEVVEEIRNAQADEEQRRHEKLESDREQNRQRAENRRQRLLEEAADTYVSFRKDEEQTNIWDPSVPITKPQWHLRPKPHEDSSRVDVFRDGTVTILHAEGYPTTLELRVPTNMTLNAVEPFIEALQEALTEARKLDG